MNDKPDPAHALLKQRDIAEDRAWKALQGYKFLMFGYWAAWWTKLNQLCPGKPRPNP